MAETGGSVGEDGYYGRCDEGLYEAPTDGHRKHGRGRGGSDLFSRRTSGTRAGVLVCQGHGQGVIVSVPEPLCLRVPQLMWASRH